ncbi:MAG: Protein-tyrosine sulfotransferase [Panacagrimonas sp.]|nr:Protein-tyrosine sulfotransferase [Panacagrimonas sp.]
MSGVKGRAPFFILGCVRSGTTMLRDLLRLHPNLDSPEETHFYRPSEPFGTPAYKRWVTHNKTLGKHRAMDGITEAEFAEILGSASSRRDLYRRYMELFISRRRPQATRWFDKTPQNVYGGALIAQDFPNAVLVHIVRNPWDVISSLRIGRVVKIEDVIGACNYWREAVEIIQTLKRAYPKRVHELKYEDLVASPEQELQRLLAFIGEPYDPSWFARFRLAARQHDVEQLFSEAERQMVPELCGPMMEHFGYRTAVKGAVDVASGVR